MSAKLIVLSITASAVALFAGCTDSQSKAHATASETIPAGVQEIIRTVNNSDIDGFARIVRYPLERPYPLPAIEDARQMRAYYTTLVDDSLRRIIIGGQWSGAGWRGWTVDDGRYVWSDGDSIYDIGYTSAAELTEMAQLTAAEMASLHPSLRGAWQPVCCYRGESYLLRIDSNPAEVYRLAIYAPDAQASDLPAHVLFGNISREGSMLDISYVFPAGTEGTYVIDTAPADSATPLLVLPTGEEIPLRRARW